MAGRVNFFPAMILILMALVAQTVAAGEEYVPKKDDARWYVEQSDAALLQLEVARDFKPFRQCRNCTCCPTHGGKCMTMKCCYVIKCNLTKKTPGKCYLVPLACNCANCSM